MKVSFKNYINGVIDDEVKLKIKASNMLDCII